MRVRLVLLLAAAAFYTNAEVDSVATDSTPSTPTSRHLRAAEKDDAHVQRFLMSFRLPWNSGKSEVEMFIKVNSKLQQKMMQDDSKFNILIGRVKKHKDAKNDPDEYAVAWLLKYFSREDLQLILNEKMKLATTKTLATALSTKLNNKVLAEEKLAAAKSAEEKLAAAKSAKEQLAKKQLADIAEQDQQELARDIRVVNQKASKEASVKQLKSKIREVNEQKAKKQQLASSSEKSKLHGKLDETAVMKRLQNMGSIDESAAFQVLLSHHKGSDVSKVLFPAQKKRSAVADRFLQKLSERWKQQDYHPNDAFKAMMLHEDGSFFTSKALEFWEDYVKAYNKRHRGTDEMDLAGALLANVRDDDLYKAIVAAEGNTGTKQMAEKIQQEWITSFIQRHDKNKEAFMQDGGLKSKVLVKLSAFLLKNEDVSLANVPLRKATQDYLTALVSFIDKAKTNPVYKKQATTLEEQLHVAWKESKLHQDIAFKIYDARGKTNDNPMKAAWLAYQKKLVLATDEQPPKSIT